MRESAHRYRNCRIGEKQPSDPRERARIKNMASSVTEHIDQSEDLILWLDSFIVGLSVPTNDRTVIVAACQDVALEHHKSIVLTTREQFYGSAFALIRLQFEAYVRGQWLRYCASDDELATFKERDKLDKKFGEIIGDLESHETFDEGVLSNIKVESWRAMNSFTHTGLLQVIRRISTTEIGSNYPEEEIIGTLDFADSMALLAALAIVNVTIGEEADREALAEQLLERRKEFAVNN